MDAATPMIHQPARPDRPKQPRQPVQEAQGPPQGPSVDHEWPSDPAEHVWGPWMPRGEAPGGNFLEYRRCVHPQCSQTQDREVEAW